MPIRAILKIASRQLSLLPKSIVYWIKLTRMIMQQSSIVIISVAPRQLPVSMINVLESGSIMSPALDNNHSLFLLLLHISYKLCSEKLRGGLHYISKFRRYSEKGNPKGLTEQSMIESLIKRQSSPLLHSLSQDNSYRKKKPPIFQN